MIVYLRRAIARRLSCIVIIGWRHISLRGNGSQQAPRASVVARCPLERQWSRAATTHDNCRCSNNASGGAPIKAHSILFRFRYAVTIATATARSVALFAQAAQHVPEKTHQVLHAARSLRMTRVSHNTGWTGNHGGLTKSTNCVESPPAIPIEPRHLALKLASHHSVTHEVEHGAVLNAHSGHAPPHTQ